MTTLALGSPGPLELLLIGAIVVLLFGARKLPELARSMGSSITQFKKGLKDELPDGKDSTEDQKKAEDEKKDKDGE